jgi:hypothetical protein
LKCLKDTFRIERHVCILKVTLGNVECWLSTVVNRQAGTAKPKRLRADCRLRNIAGGNGCVIGPSPPAF